MFQYNKKEKGVPSVLEVGGSIDNSFAEVQGDEVTNPMSENSSGTTLSDIKDTNSSEKSYRLERCEPSKKNAGTR